MTQFESRMIASQDGTPLLLRHLRGACPQGPVVLIGHGPSVHSGLLLEAIAAFGEHCAAVWAGDLRGHGGSVSGTAPLAHLDPEAGWRQLLEDTTAFARAAFRGVPRERRVLVGGAMSGHLMLEVLAGDPDLARHLVMAAPSPQQPGVGRLAAAFLRLRALSRPVDQPDPQLLHHVYGFLRAQLPGRATSVETITADPEIQRRIMDDPRGFPTPTPGYWGAVFPSMSATWTRILPGSLPEDLRVMVLSGPDDPQTRGGALVPRVLDWFRGRGVADARATLIDGVRANVLIDAPRLPVVGAVMDWIAGDVPTAAPPVAADPYLPALRALGVASDAGLPPLPVLIDLCYAALQDDSRWIELIYRLSLAAEAEGHDVDAVLETLHPHWERAFELREELRRAALMGRLYDDLIDRLDLGVAVLDAEGQMRHANPAFARALARIAPAAAPDPGGWLRRVLAEGPSEGDRALVHEGRAVGVSFVPATLRGTGTTGQPGGRLVVLRAPATAPADIGHRAGLLSLAHGLTGQEGIAALHLAEGRGTDQIAAAMGIAEGTVRSHLKQVFAKMEVASRTELTHRVMGGPLGWIVAPDSASHAGHPALAPSTEAARPPEPGGRGTGRA